MGLRPAPRLHTLVMIVVTLKWHVNVKTPLKRSFPYSIPYPLVAIVRARKAETAVKNEKVPCDEQLFAV